MHILPEMLPTPILVEKFNLSVKKNFTDYVKNARVTESTF